MLPFEVFCARICLGCIYNATRFALMSASDSITLKQLDDPNSPDAKFIAMCMSRGIAGCVDFRCAAALRGFLARSGRDPTPEEARALVPAEWLLEGGPSVAPSSAPPVLTTPSVAKL